MSKLVREWLKELNMLWMTTHQDRIEIDQRLIVSFSNDHFLAAMGTELCFL